MRSCPAGAALGHSALADPALSARSHSYRDPWVGIGTPTAKPAAKRSRQPSPSQATLARGSCSSILRRTVRHVVERNPTAMWWSETVKRDTLSHTGVVLFQWTIALFYQFVLSGAIIWKIGLYERIMALARWAILVVGVNTELVYFIMFIEGLSDDRAVIWFRTETGTVSLKTVLWMFVLSVLIPILPIFIIFNEQ